MYKLKDFLIDFVIVLLISINYIGKSYDLIIIIFNHLIKKNNKLGKLTVNGFSITKMIINIRI